MARLFAAGTAVALVVGVAVAVTAERPEHGVASGIFMSPVTSCGSGCAQVAVQFPPKTGVLKFNGLSWSQGYVHGDVVAFELTRGHCIAGAEHSPVVRYRCPGGAAAAIPPKVLRSVHA